MAAKRQWRHTRTPSVTGNIFMTRYENREKGGGEASAHSIVDGDTSSVCSCEIRMIFHRYILRKEENIMAEQKTHLRKSHVIISMLRNDETRIEGVIVKMTPQIT